LTGHLSGFLAADGVSATYSRTSGEGCRRQPLLDQRDAQPGGVLSNYDVTYHTATFTISARRSP